MKLYYTDKFKGNKKDSRELLAKCIEKAMEERGETVNGKALLLRIEVSENGKPRIPNIPDYSISHSGNYWAIIFDSMPCGLDIQLSKNGRLEKINAKYYSKAEQELVRKFGKSAFFRIWSRREALIKAAGSTVFSELPDTLADEVYYENSRWKILDFKPFSDNDVYAAICVYAESEIKRKDEIELIKIDREI